MRRVIVVIIVIVIVKSSGLSSSSHTHHAFTITRRAQCTPSGRGEHPVPDNGKHTNHTHLLRIRPQHIFNVAALAADELVDFGRAERVHGGGKGAAPVVAWQAAACKQHTTSNRRRYVATT
jgi:hypothetical protein